MDMVTSAPPIALPELNAARAEQHRARLTWALIAILVAFWIDVTLSNVLYARSMSMEFDPDGTQDLFAPWDARVLQHLMLFPLLLGAIWISLRAGWRPAWRAVPVQVLLGLAFAFAAQPLLNHALSIVNVLWPRLQMVEITAMHAHAQEASFHGIPPVWVASAINFLLAYGFALALVTGFALYRRHRDSQLRLAALERAWSGARLAALRMQLSPHTLFNLLHTIRGQIGWDPAAAQTMVVQLGDLLRRLLSAGERDFASLDDELDFARLYLELQQRRFTDRLTLTLPDAAAVPRTWVPSLILQPLIENAVAHGLAEHAGPVTVRIEAVAQSGELILRVVNTIARARERGPDGVGLRNVRERLAVHFAGRASFAAACTGPTEWAAEIRMPLAHR